MRPRTAQWLIAIAFGLCAGPLRAEPTLWERARDPELAVAERVLVRLERVLGGLGEEGDESVAERLVPAEPTGAPGVDDPRVRLLLARVELDLDRADVASAIAKNVLARISGSAPWLEAEARATLALAARDSAEDAIGLVTLALSFVVEPSVRAALLRQRGAAELCLGRSDRALEDYRGALLAGGDSRQELSSRVGLALALERSGDLPAALQELRIAKASATRREAERLFTSEAFPFRPQDAAYASALTALAVAKRASDPSDAASAYRSAAADFDRFVTIAPPDDPLLPLSRRRRDEAGKESERLETLAREGFEKPSEDEGSGGVR